MYGYKLKEHFFLYNRLYYRFYRNRIDFAKRKLFQCDLESTSSESRDALDNKQCFLRCFGYVYVLWRSKYRYFQTKETLFLLRGITGNRLVIGSR